MRTISALLVVAASLVVPGCIAIAAAAVAAGVVHATSDDSSEVTLERSWSKVFSASIAEMEAKGHVDVRDEEAGRVEGHVASAKVVITMSRSTENTVKVRVTARKLEGVSPAPDVAQDIALGLVKRLGY